MKVEDEKKDKISPTALEIILRRLLAENLLLII